MAKVSIPWLKKIKNEVAITPNWVGNGLVMFRRSVYCQHMTIAYYATRDPYTILDPTIIVFSDDAKIKTVIEEFRIKPTCQWHKTSYLYEDADATVYRLFAKNKLMGFDGMRDENIFFLQECILQKVGDRHVLVGLKDGSLMTDNIDNPSVIMTGFHFT